jgi:hypothetical protein
LSLSLGLGIGEVMTRLEVHPIPDLGHVYAGRTFVVEREGDSGDVWLVFRARDGRRTEYLARLVFERSSLAGWSIVESSSAEEPATALAESLIGAVRSILSGTPGASPVPAGSGGVDVRVSERGDALTIRLADRQVHLRAWTASDGTRRVELVHTVGSVAR